jgi:hypothetical protein
MANFYKNTCKNKEFKSKKIKKTFTIKLKIIFNDHLFSHPPNIKKNFTPKRTKDERTLFFFSRAYEHTFFLI